ncbi:hypothetical protein K0M31_009846 [Melipona bicolor]|uniref:Uncharacterized protein n=1 Tax=Melipona bicolor TaxID=60889 RepID=A0AA40KJ24_9HYME|nr:hypothetical protein K0M31_009846 [Melipona bicolor]
MPRSVRSFDAASKEITVEVDPAPGGVHQSQGHGGSATHGSKGHAHAVFTVAAVNLLAASAVRFLREQLDTAEGFRGLCIILSRNKFPSKRYDERTRNA